MGKPSDRGARPQPGHGRAKPSGRTTSAAASNTPRTGATRPPQSTSKRPPQSAGKPASRPTNKKGKPKKPLGVRILIWFGVTILSLAVLAGGTFAVAYAVVQVPDPNADFQTNTTDVYYSDGKTLIGSFQVQNRQSIPYDQMNTYAKEAIVAAENRTFWTDPGVSPLSMLRAGWTVLKGGDVTGASTITQQYIKVMYLTQEKTITRKLEEILLAAKMGRQLSKEQILEGYLNTVYVGRGAYGLEAASQAFFGKPQAKLSLAEATALMCIINNPSQYDPAAGDDNATELLGRYQYALNSMVEMGYITPAERATVYDKLPKFPKVKKDSRLGGTKGFLLTMVQKELSSVFTEQQINGGGLQITTTFDKDAQKAAVASAQKMALQASNGNKKKAANLHPALASIDNKTGGVLALYSSSDYVKDSHNRANTPRPTASTFKTYALVAGLRDGWTLNDRLRGNSYTPEGDSTPVHNDSGESWGRPTLLQSVTHSINTAFVDLVTQIPDGPNQVIKAATDAGAHDNDTWHTGIKDRIALGTAEVSPLDQASAYSTFANRGIHIPWHVVATVKDSQGKTVYDATAQQDLKGKQTIEMGVADDVTYALSKVTQDGTGRSAGNLGYPVAGKTGTGSVPKTKKEGRGTKTVVAWFVGYTKQITTSVLYTAGKDDYSNLDDYGSFYGSGYPAQTWLDYMKTAMDGKDKVDFPDPTGRTSSHDSGQGSKPKPSSTPTPKATATPTPTVNGPAKPTASAPPTVPPVQPPQPSKAQTTRPTASFAPKPSQKPTPKPTPTAAKQPEKKAAKQPVQQAAKQAARKQAAKLSDPVPEPEVATKP